MMSRVVLVCLVAFSAGAAVAQTNPPPPVVANSPLGGPHIQGVCLLSQVAVLANSKVGLAATARLRMLGQQAQTELGDERKSLDAEMKALDSGKLKPVDKLVKQQALAPRLQALQEKANLRTREIEATRQKALQRITIEEQPVIAAAYKAHGCGLLFDRNTVLAGNFAGDLTADVVKGLDDRMTTITFDRERLSPDK
jgi:Skp family chaperone for outer membrane proteins